MAYANRPLIAALERTAARLRANVEYSWGHLGMCNCGQLAQAVTGRSRAEIHRAALEFGGEWQDRARDYCPTSGRAIDDIIAELMELGLGAGDLADLEYLRDPAVLRRLPSGRRWLERNQREDVIEYLDAWAALLRDDLERRDALSRTTLVAAE